MSQTRRREALFSESGHKRILKERYSERDEETDSHLYPRGALKRLSVQNFMTFAEATVDFDPKLNLFIAPNGTGKSSLVCALCIGLGGRPLLLARQSRLSEFVRRGEEHGSVEVWLSGGEEHADTHIKRIIHSHKEASEWNLNGAPATLREIERFMKSMNIQLNNLLQFMPQDRVSEFASLSPVRLLEETEKAVDAELYDMHETLIGMAKTLKDSGQTSQNLENDIKRVTGLMKNLERDVERLRQVTALKKEVSQIEAKILLLSIHEIKEELKKSAEHMRTGESDVKNKQTRLRQLSDKLIEIRKKSDKLQSDKNRLRQQISGMETENAGLMERRDREEDLIEEKIAELKDLAAESVKHREKITSLQERVDALRLELQQIPELSDEKKKEYEDLKKESDDRESQLRTLQYEMDNVKHQQLRVMNKQQELTRQMQRLDNINVRLVQSLERKRPLFKGLLNAYEALKNHRDRFQMPVIGPIITEITLRDPLIASYLESQVPVATWTLFIVQCDDDMRTIKSLQLMQELNVINFGGRLDDSVQPTGGHAWLSRYGVTGCLKDHFEAPEIVKQVLDGECNLRGTFVGAEEACGHVKALFDSDNSIVRLYTPQRSYTCTKSRYSATSSVSTSQLRRADLLGKDRMAPEERPELERLCAEARQEYAPLVEKEKSIEEDARKTQLLLTETKKMCEAIDQERKDSERKRMICTRRLHETQKQLTRMQGMPDPLTMETERKAEIHDMQNRLLGTIKEMNSSLTGQWALHGESSINLLRSEEMRQLCSKAESDAAAMSNKIDEQQRLLVQLRDVVKADRIRLQRAEQELTDKYPDYQEWEAELKNLPSDSDQLEDLASEKRYQARTLTCNNPDAMTSYEQLQTQVVALEAELERSKTFFDQTLVQVEHVKRRWLKKLQEATEKINAAFVDNFLAIGCIGQVALSGEEIHGREFQNYALEIKVKFRAAEPLRILDSVRQSGGERVVATTLYLLSLQSVSHIPFRVMDEINHGMDEENERRVMNILASNAGSRSMPQTFVFTPKMFSNPEFLKHATCHLIANGHLDVTGDN